MHRWFLQAVLVGAAGVLLCCGGDPSTIVVTVDFVAFEPGGDANYQVPEDIDHVTVELSDDGTGQELASSTVELTELPTDVSFDADDDWPDVINFSVTLLKGTTLVCEFNTSDEFAAGEANHFNGTVDETFCF